MEEYEQIEFQVPDVSTNKPNNNEIDAPPAKRLRCNDEGELNAASEKMDKSSEDISNINVLDNNKTLNIINRGETSNDDESISTDTTVAQLCKTAPAHLRQFMQIPVFIVDFHNEVLEFIYRCMGSRHIPAKNNILVHFDSHPDMAISRDITPSQMYDKDCLLNELSIENWIMPSCFTGHFNRIVWLKNSWCEQMPLGKYKFKIGHKNDVIHVDCPLEYFMSEGNYCDTDELEEAREIELRVHNTDTTNVDPNEFLSTADKDNFILDIDLDYFSTANPFFEIYNRINFYEQIGDIFAYKVNESDPNATTQQRKEQLDALKGIFEYLEEKRNFERHQFAEYTDILSEDILNKIHHLYKTLHEYYEDDELDWLLVYDSGCTTDNKGLPHNVSNSTQLELYYANFKKFLERLPVAPVIVTIACSTEDGYCPKHQVDSIKNAVLSILREVFGKRLHDKPIMYYLDEEWDVMKL